MSGDFHGVRYASASPFPPKLMERENSLKETLNSVPSKGLFPSSAILETLEDGNLVARLKDFGRTGSIIVGRSLKEVCNLRNHRFPRPPSVVCDALLVSDCVPPTLVTFAEEEEETIRRYNKSVAQAMMYARYFTDEHFDVLYVVAKCPRDVRTPEAFAEKLRKAFHETSSYSIEGNLLQSEERRCKIFRAFLTMSVCSMR